MAESGDFSSQVQRFRKLIEEGAEAGLLVGSIEIAFQELLSLAEELEVTEEELRQQNEELVELQNELDLERQHFQNLFQLAPSGYLVTDPHGVILEANQAAFEMLAVSSASIAGKPLILFVFQEDWQEFLDRLAHLSGLIAPKRERFSDWIIRFGQKKEGFLHVSIDAVFTAETTNVDEQVGGTIRWILHDITRQKTLEAELTSARRRLIFGSEQERQQIAREIHDSPIQDLMGALILISGFANQDKNEDDLAKLEEVRQVITKSARALQVIIGQLRPPAITPFGLEKAIRSHALDIQTSYPDIQFHLELTQDKLTLPEEIRLSLFRIYQNSILNVVRHSGAQNATVSFEIRDGTAFLQVEDDGIGFKVPERWATLVLQGHLGLANAAERAEILGGQFQVDSTPGKGTVVRVMIPTSV